MNPEDEWFEIEEIAETEPPRGGVDNVIERVTKKTADIDEDVSPSGSLDDVMTKKTADIDEDVSPSGSLDDAATKKDQDLALHTHKRMLWARQTLALGLLLLVAILSLVILVSAFFTSDGNYEQVKEIAPIVFSPLVTLLGTAVAWYYATKDK